MEFSDLEVLKNEANSEMKLGQFQSALGKYESIIDQLSSSPDITASESRRPMYMACLNNMSMAYLKLQKYEECIKACTDGLQLDAKNLKAYYRRAQAYKEIAYNDSGNPSGKPQLKDDYWGFAALDVESILNYESENAQGKALKNEIRKSKNDQEANRKYNMKYGSKVKSGGNGEDEVDDLPSVYDEMTLNDSADTNRNKNKKNGTAGSVFKGYPTLKDEDDNGTISRTEGTPQQPVYETLVARDQAGEALKNHFVKENKVEDKYDKEYGFLNPDWSPKEETSEKRLYGSTLGGTAPDPAVKAVAIAAKNKPSFNDLLNKAKGNSVQFSSNIDGNNNGQTTTKSLPANKAVDGALEDLLSTEKAAKQKVTKTLKVKQGAVGAEERKRGQSKLSKKSKEFQEEQERLTKEPTVLSAWEQLQFEENDQKKKFMQLTTSTKKK